MWNESKRNYTNILTGESFNMNVHSDTHELRLINQKGEIINAYVIAAFTDMDYKFKNGEVKRIRTGEFMPIDKTNPATHKKFFIQQRFSKIK